MTMHKANQTGQQILDLNKPKGWEFSLKLYLQTKSKVGIHSSVKIISIIVLFVLWVVIAAQCAATILRSIVLPRI